MTDEMRPAVHDAPAHEWPTLYESLALAFEDDPVSEFLFPDDASRVRSLKRFYELSVPTLVEHGRLIAPDGLEGAAVWQAPSPPRPAKLPQFWLLARILILLGRQTGPGLQLVQTLERAHLREPHWYLGLLGTAPAHQGKGLGSAMMQPLLDTCDEQGIVAYLESSKLQNIPFYERHGFALMEEIEVPKGPKLWPMRREPQRR